MPWTSSRSSRSAAGPRRLARIKVLHRVDQYARDVRMRRIVAGPLVRLACQRHEEDRKAEKVKGFHFDPVAADHAIGFIERWVRLPDTQDEQGDAKRFLLEPWQAFIVGSLFGWKWTESGYRRFRNAFIEIGKGNGKTPLLAAIGLYGLMMDGQKAPEIYAAAADRDQAMIMFRDAVRMVDASPELSRRVQKSGIQHVHNMAYGLGFFRPFSREQSSKSGTRPHMGLIDEVHEHPNADIVNKMRAGAKGNMDALFPEITNSGFDRTSICFQHHEHSRRIVERTVADERWFAYVCDLDEDDDPLNDPTCWIKANPNLGVSIQREYLEDQVSAAKNISAETNTVLRLNFCVWTHAQTRAIDMTKWHACGPMPSDAELKGQRCFGGLDLGMSDDFSAWIRLWVLRDGRVAVKARFWIPQAALELYPNRPYDEWKKAGILTVTEGETTDYGVIESTILSDCHTDGVREVAYDNRFAEQMAQNLAGKGIAVVNTPQGFQLNEPIRRKLELINTGKLCHGNDPILGWMASNYVLRHGTKGEVRPDKEHAGEKIDGQVAIDMAMDRYVRAKAEPPREYQMIVLSGR
jgi:phage terminase large subunit-like protein